MHDDGPQTRLSLWQIMGVFLYVGIAGYGGGPAIIGYMHQLLVEQRKLVQERDFHSGLSLSQMLPGATALDMVVFLGYRLRGIPGAILAPICFIIPAMVMMIALSAVYFAYGEVPLVQALFIGLGAVVVALLLNGVVSLGRSAIKDRWSAGIAIVTFLVIVLLTRFQVPASLHLLVIIPFGAIVGLLVYGRQPVRHEDTASETAHPRWFWWAWWGIVLLAGAALALTASWQPTRLFLAILRVGVFTFGGGFMAIPLFQQVAVEAHGWLTAREFLDGIALGQVTPGPVLITATFIGYRVLGIVGAVVATIAVFLPGAVAMFVLALHHERVRHLAWLQAMVRGVVAGYIGLLLNVTVQLARHSLIDGKTIILAAVATLVLLRWKTSPIWVILGAAVVSPWLFAR